MMPPPMFGSMKKKKKPGMIVAVGTAKVNPPKFGEDPDAEGEPDPADPNEADEPDEAEDPMDDEAGESDGPDKETIAMIGHHLQECSVQLASALQLFDKLSGHAEPDEDQMGGPSDHDADNGMQ